MINYFNLIEIEILKGGNKEWTSYIMFIAAVSISDNFYIFGGKLENKGINITTFYQFTEGYFNNLPPNKVLTISLLYCYLRKDPLFVSRKRDGYKSKYSKRCLPY